MPTKRTRFERHVLSLRNRASALVTELARMGLDPQADESFLLRDALNLIAEQCAVGRDYMNGDTSPYRNPRGTGARRGTFTHAVRRALGTARTEKRS